MEDGKLTLRVPSYLTLTAQHNTAQNRNGITGRKEEEVVVFCLQVRGLGCWLLVLVLVVVVVVVDRIRVVEEDEKEKEDSVKYLR